MSSDTHQVELPGLRFRCARMLILDAGGILADDQGLGKTVSTIALLVSSLPSRAARLPMPAGRAGSRGLGRPADSGAAAAAARSASAASASGPEANGAQRPCTAPDLAGLPAAEEMVRGGTLVVCPIAVLHQWSRELAEKVAPSAGAASPLGGGRLAGPQLQTVFGSHH